MNKKHLTYDDRLAIQVEPQKGFKVAQIAKNIGKNRVTTGRGIRAHRRLVSTSNDSNYVHHETCARILDCHPAYFRGETLIPDDLRRMSGRLPGLSRGVLF